MTGCWYESCCGSCGRKRPLGPSWLLLTKRSRGSSIQWIVHPVVQRPRRPIKFPRRPYALSCCSGSGSSASPSAFCRSSPRPHQESMDFGALLSHIATTNYQFCAGLKDADGPALPSPTEKDAVVKFLGDWFDYCSAVISGISEEQLG